MNILPLKLSGFAAALIVNATFFGSLVLDAESAERAGGPPAPPPTGVIVRKPGVMTMVNRSWQGACERARGSRAAAADVRARACNPGEPYRVVYHRSSSS